MKIALLTSGGDAPGMNTFLEHFYKNAKRNNCSVFGVRQGFQGLIDNKIAELEDSDVDDISVLGGSILKSYRSEEFMTNAGFKKAIDTIKANKFDCIVGVGGEGTLRGLRDLSKAGIPTIGIPATIDNDVFYTERTLGFDTAINNAVSCIDKIKDTFKSSDRGVIIEVMGRYCGDLALSCALAVYSDKVITKSTGFDYKELLSDIKQMIAKGKTSPLIVAQENCFDIFKTAGKLEKDLKMGFRANQLGYVQRGGAPSVYDRILALKFAITAVKMVEQQQFNIVLGVKKDFIFSIPISDIEVLGKPNDEYLYEIING